MPNFFKFVHRPIKIEQILYSNLNPAPPLASERDNFGSCAGSMLGVPFQGSWLGQVIRVTLMLGEGWVRVRVSRLGLGLRLRGVVHLV